MLKMNFAIIGCGFIAKKHAAAIENIEGAKLVAVSDKIAENMQSYHDEFGADMYEDSEEMLKREDIDIVSICTPTGLHAPLAIQVAHAKKHIILEKPIAMNLEEADEIIQSCEVNSVKLGVVHPNRYRPVVKELKRILDKNLIGEISHANAIVNWNRNQAYYDQSPWRGTKKGDGGALMNQAIHNLDLLLWFMGDVEEVFSMEATRFRDIEAEDVSNGVVRFKNGALGLVQASTTVYPKNFEESITLFGERGTIKIGGSNALYFEHLEIAGVEQAELERLKTDVEKGAWGKPGHQHILEDMISAVKNNHEPAINGKEGRRSLELVLAMYESAERQKLVRLTGGKSHVN